MSAYITNVVKALAIGDDEILPGIAWSTKEGYRSHMRHPFVLGTDVTFGENAEKQPHIQTVGKMLVIRICFS